MEHQERITCPHCFQALTVSIDLTAGAHQQFVLDCEICCRPILLRARVSGEDVSVEASAESD